MLSARFGRRATWLRLLVWTAWGCGGSASSEGPGTPATQAQVEALCDAQCGYEDRCGADPENPPCSECVDQAFPPALFRRDFMEAVTQCFERLTCDGSDDRCTDEGLTRVDPNVAELPLLRECDEIAEECGFSEDLCAFWVAFTDSARARFEACLAQDCDRVATCIGGILFEE